MDSILTHNQSDLQGLNPKHLAEWQGSGIDDRLIAANLKSRSGNSAYDDLLYSDDIPRRNDGRLTDGFLKSYRHLEDGGWWVNGIDPITGEDRLFGLFKPDNPRRDKDGKLVRYEQPPKVCYEPIFLRIPDAIADQCAANVGLSREWSEAKADGLGFWEWIIARPQVPIWFTEGVKKAAGLISQGKVAIALTSISTACLPKPKDLPNYVEHFPELLPDLKQFATKHRQINICFDQDEKETTKKAVFSQVKKIGKLFKNLGCRVYAIVWNQEYGKGIDDVIVKNPEWETLVKAEKLLDYINNIQDKQLTYPINLMVNMRYLENLDIPKGTRIIGLSSAKGTNKTGWIGDYIKPYLNQGFRILLGTHRRQLGRELCDRLGVDYIDELVEGKSLTNGLYGYGLVIDSLHSKARVSFDFEKWNNSAMPYIFVLDECEQILWHLLSGDTEVKTNRTEVITNFNKLLKGSYQTILSDADLSNLSLNYARSVMTFTDEETGIKVTPNIYLVLNEYTPEPYDCVVFEDNHPTGLVLEMEKQLEAGKKIFACVASQQVKSLYSAQNLEKRFQKLFPNLKILRVCKDTIADPNHPAYGITGNLDQVLSQYDLVLATTVVETGISINTPHFDTVFGIFSGVQTTNAVRQNLIRVRKNVPRYIWINQQGLSNVGNGATNYQDLMDSNKQLFGRHIKNLAASGMTESIDGNVSSIALETYGKMAVRINWGNRHYRQEILKGLKTEGHNLIIRKSDKDLINQIREDIKADRDVNYQEYCQKVSIAKDLTDSEFESLDKQLTKTESERLQHRKGQLKRLYEIDVTENLVKADEDKLNPRLRLHYYLTIGRDFVAERDRRVAEKQSERGKGKVWIPDFNRSQMQTKVQTLEFLGMSKEMIDRLTQGTWSKNSPELIAIAEKATLYGEGLKTALGIGISESMGTIRIIQSLLGTIGLRLPSLKREGNGRAGKSERERIYGPVESKYEKFASTPSNVDSNWGDGRTAIMTAWYLKDLAERENRAVILPLAA